MSAVTATARPGRLRWRLAWLVPGLAIAVVGNLQATEHGLGIAPLLAFGILPHIPAWIGIGRSRGRGAVARFSVALFNVMHHPALPATLVGLSAATVLPPFWSVAGLAWLSHVVIDWALGDGLRAADGSRREWWRSR